MTEVWQLSIPFGIFIAGYFHYFLAETFQALETRENTVFWLCLLWFGAAYFLVADGVFAIYLLARDTVSADMTLPTFVAYIVVLTTMGFSFLYFIVMSFYKGADKQFEAVRRFLKW